MRIGRACLVHAVECVIYILDQSVLPPVHCRYFDQPTEAKLALPRVDWGGNKLLGYEVNNLEGTVQWRVWLILSVCSLIEVSVSICVHHACSACPLVKNVLGRCLECCLGHVVE